MEINYADIGKRIQARRKILEMTQEKLAEIIDISIGHLSGIENGKTKFSFPTIVQIANVLEMSMDELLCGSLIIGKIASQNEVTALLSDCTPQETTMIIDIIKAAKKSLRNV